MLQRVGRSFDLGKRVGEIDGKIRIRECVFEKSCSLPSNHKFIRNKRVGYLPKTKGLRPVYVGRRRDGRTSLR